MRALVVYESMYGNTHTVAAKIGEGLRVTMDVTVVPVGEATPAMVEASNVVVCGGPTHAHGMSSASSRKAALAAAEKPDAHLDLDPAAEGEGLRDWLESMGEGDKKPAGAAFDTRIDAPGFLTGHASHGIARRLRHHGFCVALEPMSFLVDRQNHLLEGEADRAVAWGAEVAAAVGATHPSASPR